MTSIFSTQIISTKLTTYFFIRFAIIYHFSKPSTKKRLKNGESTPNVNITVDTPVKEPQPPKRVDSLIKHIDEVDVADWVKKEEIKY